MSKSQRTKGAAWERAVRDFFIEAMPGATVRRGLGQARSGGEVADVDCPVFWVECKVGKMPNPRAALEQAKEAAAPGRIPIAVVKDDRHEPFVCLALDDFLDFVKEWWEANELGKGNGPPPTGHITPAMRGVKVEGVMSGREAGMKGIPVESPSPCCPDFFAPTPIPVQVVTREQAQEAWGVDSLLASQEASVGVRTTEPPLVTTEELLARVQTQPGPLGMGHLVLTLQEEPQPGDTVALGDTVYRYIGSARWTQQEREKWPEPAIVGDCNRDGDHYEIRYGKMFACPKCRQARQTHLGRMVEPRFQGSSDTDKELP